MGNGLIGTEFQCCKMKKMWRSVKQQCECTDRNLKDNYFEIINDEAFKNKIKILLRKEGGCGYKRVTLGIFAAMKLFFDCDGGHIYK